MSCEDALMPLPEERPSLVVEFTQRLKLYPPESIEDGVEAESWFWDSPSHVVWDGLDADQGSFEVIEVNG